MSFNKALWFGLFNKGGFPALPCPFCESGRLQEVEGTFSKDEADYPDDIPDVTKAFVMLARCNVPNCRNFVSVAGHCFMDTTVTEFGEEPGEVMNIEAIIPPSPMIDLPYETPHSVRGHLERSFALYWMDYGACANRIRSAAEAILDELRVPKTKRVKAKPATPTQPAKPAKTITLDFNGRIQWLQKRNRKNARLVDALRKIGNLGSHGHDVDQKDLHAAMKLIDYLLSELFEKHVIASCILKCNKWSRFLSDFRSIYIPRAHVKMQQMRKRTKLKRRACALCKPHKRCRTCRWSSRDRARLIEWERDRTRLLHA